MSEFQLYKRHAPMTLLSALSSVIERWCLDSPESQQDVTGDSLLDPGVEFRGWILASEPSALERIRVFIRQGEEFYYFPLSVERKDVVKAFAKPESMSRCGFRFQLPIMQGDFSFGLCVGDEYTTLLEFSVKGPFDILRGREGWLFLDNDTNQSVLQHTGQLLLDEQQQAEWHDYFVCMQRAAESRSVQFATLIAPSKEAVYQEFHPLPRSPSTVTEQLLALKPDGYPLVYPDTLLREATQRPTFRKKDSHWTHYGAMLATVQVAGELGLAKKQIFKMFAGDKYFEKDLGGDLGNKVFPVEKSVEWLIKGRYQSRIIFDNGLENFGRAMVLQNKKAVHTGHCVIFGSSSAYSMLEFLSRIFTNVTLLHTAANIDIDLMCQLQPDYVIGQSNARFVIRAPSVRYDFAEVLKLKLQTLDCEQRRRIIDAATPSDTALKNAAVQVLWHQLQQSVD